MVSIQSPTKIQVAWCGRRIGSAQGGGAAHIAARARVIGSEYRVLEGLFVPNWIGWWGVGGGGYALGRVGVTLYCV